MTVARHVHVRLFLVAVAALAPAPGAAQWPGETAPPPSLDSLLGIQVSVASKYAQYTRDAPASIAVITSEEIRRFGYRTLAEALRNSAGFYTSSDRNYTYLGVRGFSRPTDTNNRVLLQVDGHSLNDNFFDAASLGTTFGLDLELVDRIEVVRGPASALYGSGAMLAIVNVVLKSGNALDGAHVSGELGSYGLRSASARFGRVLRDGTEFVVAGNLGELKGQDLFFSEFDNPLTNDGVARDLDWERLHAAYVMVRRGGLRFSAMRTERKKGIPTAPWETLFNDRAAQTRDVRTFAELAFQTGVGLGLDLDVRAYLDSYQYSGLYPYELPEGDWAERSVGRWFGGEARFRWDLSAANRISFGAEYQQHLRADFQANDAVAGHFDANFPFKRISTYAQNELQILESLSLTVGARADRYSQGTHSISPRAALVFHANPVTTLKLLYGSAFRVPTQWEAHYEEEGAFKTNPALRPERIQTWEVTWEQRLAKSIISKVSLFDYRMQDLIDETIDPTDGLGLYSNRSRVDSRGVELELSARLRSGVSGFARYSFARAVDADAQVLTNSPRHLVRMGAAAPIPYGILAAVDISYDAGRRTVANADTKAFVLANARISRSGLRGRVKLSLTVHNLLNESYKTPGGFEHRQAGIPQDGRTLRVRLDMVPRWK